MQPHKISVHNTFLFCIQTALAQELHTELLCFNKTFELANVNIGASRLYTRMAAKLLGTVPEASQVPIPSDHQPGRHRLQTSRDCGSQAVKFSWVPRLIEASLEKNCFCKIRPAVIFWCPVPKHERSPSSLRASFFLRAATSHDANAIAICPPAHMAGWNDYLPPKKIFNYRFPRPKAIKASSTYKFEPTKASGSHAGPALSRLNLANAFSSSKFARTRFKTSHANTRVMQQLSV